MVLVSVRSSFCYYSTIFNLFSVITIMNISKMINRMNCIIKEVIEIPNIMSKIVHIIPKGRNQ